MNELHHPECAQRDVAVGWALHALEPEEEAGFAKHLPHCEDCEERVRSTEAVAALLGEGVQQLDPPPRLRAAILAAARAQQPITMSPAVPGIPVPRRLEVVAGRGTADIRPSLGRSTPRIQRVLVAAAAIGVIAFGAGWAGNALVGTSSSTTQSALPALSNASVHSTPITGSKSGQVMAVVLSDGALASVIPVSMPSAPTGQAYWLWGTGGAKGAPIALGKVSPGDGAAADLQRQSSGQPMGFTGYALSVESDQAVPVAPSTVIGTSGTI